MNVTRKTTSPVPTSSDDQDDWALEILQALISPSTAEDAALACAAAWMNFALAERVAVAVFDSTTSCIVAHGQRDGSYLTIYVGRHTAPIAALLKPEQLYESGGPCLIEAPNHVLCWPEHMSAVLVCVEESALEEGRLDLIESLSRKLLSRWTVPVTSFANPDHMESVAEFAAGAGHEINNPLGSIIGQTQLLLKGEDRSEQRQSLETIGAQAWRIRDMIGDAMLFARPPQPEFLACDLIRLASKAVSLINAAFGDRNIVIELQSASEAIPLLADEAQISTLIAQLLRNACQAVQDNDQNRSVVMTIQREGDFAASIVVTDNGPEISPEIRRHMFDPFFSGRQAGRGLGFGLCHCWQIARMHNGLLTQESLTNGNRFTVVLPVEKDVSAFSA